MKCPNCTKPMRPEGCIWFDRAKAVICAECYAEFTKPPAAARAKGKRR